MRRKQKEARDLSRGKSLCSGSTRSLISVKSTAKVKDKRAVSPLQSAPQAPYTPTTHPVLTSDASISTTPDLSSSLSLQDFPGRSLQLRHRSGFSPGSQQKSSLLLTNRRPGSSLATVNCGHRSKEHSAGPLMSWKTSSELFASLACDSPAKTTGKLPLSGSRKPIFSWLAEPLSRQMTGYLTLKRRRLKRRSPANRPGRESALSVVITMLG